MLLFTLPILLGNVFQQIYSLSDTIVVGRFLGTDALAAVGSSSALIIFINSIIIGLCMGTGVLFAELFGAKSYKDMSAAISTSALFIMLITILISGLGLLFMEHLIQIFQVPVEAAPLAKDYLTIIFLGLPFMFLYNLTASLLRAVGNSRTPLLFLIIASSINVAFDFILVIYTDLGVKGPAWSTFLAQACSSIPLCIYAIRKLNFIQLQFRFERRLFKRIANYAVLTSLQQSIMNFGILLVQGLVNSFGVVAMAAFIAGVRIDTFAYMPAQDFGNAFATFIAQNKGAMKTERIKAGFKSALIYVSVFCSIISVFVVILAPRLIHLIVPGDLEVIELGARYLRIEGLFYILIGYLFLHYGLFRGLGYFKTSIELTVVSLGTRVLLSYTLVALGFGLHSIWWSIPIGWALADILGFIRYAQRRKLANKAAVSSEA